MILSKSWLNYTKYFLTDEAEIFSKLESKHAFSIESKHPKYSCTFSSEAPNAIASLERFNLNTLEADNIVAA
jgi:hypothetical protein